MKPKLGWLGLLLLAGCAPSAITVDDAKQYAGLGLNEFLAKRFADRQSKYEGDVVRYKAYFNDINYTQLERPTTELMNFCKAQGGTLERTQAYAGNPFGRYYVSPLAAGMEGAAYARAKGSTSTITGAVAQDRMEEAQRQNDEVNARAKGYRSLLYGEWTCQGIANPWRANVVPIEFVPRKPDGSSVVDVMLIEIRTR